jgi:hypothetical protein
MADEMRSRGSALVRTLLLAGLPRLRSASVRAGIAVALAATFAIAAPGAAVAATTTTIGFDDLPSGTTVSTQYDPQGVDFATGIVGVNVYCYPTIVTVSAGQAQSGNQVADTSCANGEFPDSSIRGLLDNSAENVSVYAGFSPTGASPPSSTAVTLTAYDVNGQVVNATTTTVPAGQGTHTLIAVSSSSPNIVAFDVTATQADVSVDDLTFDNPGGVPADFTISPQSGLVQVVQSSAVSDVVAIQRLNGSSGGVTFSTSGLPAGVHVSFSPNPATSNSTTMTVSADPTAPPPASGAFPSFTVTGTPAGAGVGSVPRSASLQVDVQPLFGISTPVAVNAPPCSTLQVPITVNPAQAFSGTVTLTANGVPADDQATFNPATLTLPGQTHSTLTLTSQSDISGPTGSVSVTATGGGVADSSGTFLVSRVPPSITSLTDSGAQQLRGGQTPQGASPDLGTLVYVHGQGFCPGSTVYFGNSLASAVTQGPFTDGLGPFGDETVIRTAVPSLATTGKVYVVRQGASVTSTGTASAPFTIDSYRDVNGFSFDNGNQFQSNVGGYSFSDVSDVFGDEQTHISVNPCWPFGDCSITTPIPDPLALAFWGIANAALQDGQCFGFSLASQRLLHGDQIYPAFPFQPGVGQPTVWNLLGPDGANGSSGASGAVAHFIHLMHLEQFSAQALHFWLSSATANALAGSQGSIMDDVTSALDAGDHPLIELRNGTEGHVVVAYEVDQANGSSLFGNGDRVIDIYNPNQEFLTSENATDGTSHQASLATSEIVVHSDGHWEFQGFSPEWHGGPGSLVVVPYGVVPVHPALPTNLSGLFDLLFGAADATQVTDSHGHRLLNADGSINTNRANRIADATQFATLSGTAKPGPDIFLFGKAGAYTTAVHGNARGEYHDTLFSHDMAASLTAAATSAVTDEVSAPANMDGLRFGQTSGPTSTTPRTATVQIVVSGSQGSQRTATIATSVPTKGQAGAMFDAAHDAVEVTAGDQPTSYTLSLSWTGPHGFPQTFVAPAVHLAAGDRATFAPADWAALQSTKVRLRVRHAHGATTTRTLENRIRPAARYTVRLRIVKVGVTRRLTISTRFIRLAAGSSALMTWEVLKGRTLVAHHNVSLVGTKLHRGLVSRTFAFRPAGSARYTFRASVELLSPAHTGTDLSQQVTRLQRFRG